MTRRAGACDGRFHDPWRAVVVVLTLSQFLLRLAFGFCAAMTIVSPRSVTSGYFRNNSYVVLGLEALATLVALSAPDEAPLYVWPPLVGALAAYASAAAWLYESPGGGRFALMTTAVLSALGLFLAMPESAGGHVGLRLFDAATSGLLLGTTLAAMLLGHWYLNAPGMKLAPLRLLIGGMMLAVALRAAASGLGLWHAVDENLLPESTQYWMLWLRWLTGIAGTAVTGVMAWLTLRIPNTQSATGILYVSVIFVFLGELCSLLLSSVSGLTL
ncbi:MAG: hypothetical protein JSS27_07625 [Planctomycetes bacterium]|nr:hypothetical protein [Planctomycetota bacterium]